MDVSTVTTNIVELTTPALDTSTLLWVTIVGFIVAFFLAFTVGANDVSNSFGTAVGSGVLKFRQVCILATIFETTGSVLLGAKVGNTIRKGIIDVSIYAEITNGEIILSLGMLATMAGSAIWQFIATLLKIPVSGTHSVVGSCVGFSVVVSGFKGLNWITLIKIAISWVVSPVLSGLASITLYWFVEKTTDKTNPMRFTKFMLPLYVGLTFFINVFSILYSGAPLIGLDFLTLTPIILIGFAISIISSLCVYFLYIPRLSKYIDAIMAGANEEGKKMTDFNTSKDSIQKICVIESNQLNKLKENEENTFGLQIIDESAFTEDSSHNTIDSRKSAKFENDSTDDDSIVKSKNESEKFLEESNDEDEDSVHESVIKKTYSSLQVLTSCFASFAHGGNDVSNAIGPLIAVWLIYQGGQVQQKSMTPWYILLYGAFGICVGLWLFGRRVIETIGKDLTKVTASRGFCIEFMTAVTVLTASNIGIPLSTTHCKVGAVIAVGWYCDRSTVKWRMVRNIGIAWFITVPMSALFTSFIMWVLLKIAV